MLLAQPRPLLSGPAWPEHPVKLTGTVDGAQEEDEAFADFVRSSASPLARTAYLLTGNRASAEDLVQDTLVRLYKRKSWLLGADVPLAYARRTLSNQFINDRRRKSSGEIVVAEVPLTEVEPDFTGELGERDQLWSLLSGLPDKQRAAIVLRYYHDLSDSDIGAALDCRDGTVRSLISRGLAALRQSTDSSVPGRGVLGDD